MPAASATTRRPFTFREEANAITCSAFRNGFIEDLHAGDHSEFLNRPGLMRITPEEMARMLTEGAAQIAALLTKKRTVPEQYWAFVAFFNQPGGYVAHWDRTEPPSKPQNQTAAPFPGPVEVEAQGIARYTFGQSHVMDLLEGEQSDLLARPELSRITQIEMALIMIGTSDRMARLLRLEVDDPAEYAGLLRHFVPRAADRASSSADEARARREH